jgi:hypothetical protein
VDFVDEALTVEDTMVGVVGLDGNTGLKSHTFEAILSKNGIGGIEGDLGFHMNHT